MPEQVSFNINPSYAKPTAVALQPTDSTLGFSFRYAMARTFPCHMTIEWAPSAVSGAAFPPILVRYEVRPSAYRRRVALMLPMSGVSMRRGGSRPLIIEAESESETCCETGAREGSASGWVEPEMATDSASSGTASILSLGVRRTWVLAPT